MGDFKMTEGGMIDLYLAYDFQLFQMSKDEIRIQPADTHFIDATYISFISRTVITQYSKKD